MLGFYVGAGNQNSGPHTCTHLHGLYHLIGSSAPLLFYAFSFLLLTGDEVAQIMAPGGGG